MTRFSFPSTRGFTLIELLVSMAIFITLVTIATGALFSAQAVNVRLEQTQSILDEFNLSMEMMVRDIRYGTTFNCSDSIPELSAPTTRQSCAYPDGGSVLVFRPATKLSGSTNQFDDRVAYYVEDGAIYKREFPSGSDARTSLLTSSDVSVGKFTFFVKGAQSKAGDNDVSGLSDSDQPVVTIVVSGVTKPPKATTPPVPFNIETTASSREIDN